MYIVRIKRTCSFQSNIFKVQISKAPFSLLPESSTSWNIFRFLWSFCWIDNQSFLLFLKWNKAKFLCIWKPNLSDLTRSSYIHKHVAIKVFCLMETFLQIDSNVLLPFLLQANVINWSCKKKEKKKIAMYLIICKAKTPEKI